ncbi:pyocin activator PrtN family protein, partial [Pseudomonas syringae group genomosp. 3]
MWREKSRAEIPLDRTYADYVHLKVEKFKRKQLDGEINIPTVRLRVDSYKAALGVHLRILRS